MTWSYKEWYRQNKEKVNAKRRKKYDEDAAFREKTQTRALEGYHAKRKTMAPTDRRTVVDEQGERFFSIGRIARLIGRQIESVRKYHRMGILPDPTYFDARGWRLYTRQQALLIRQVFRRFQEQTDVEVRTLADVRRVLHERWAEVSKEDDSGAS